MKKANDTAEHIAPERAKVIMEKLNSNLCLSVTSTLAKRELCIALLCAGIEPSQIKALTGYGVTSIKKISRAIENGREDELFVIKGGGRPSKLAKKDINLEKQITDMLDNENFYSLKQIIQEVDERFEITLSQSGLRRLLQKHGYLKRKCGSLPAKADAEAQRVFHDDILRPLMKRALESEDVVVLFMDAAHFVIGCDYLGRIYSKTRRFICTLSGRQRRNVLGALDYKTKKVLTVENDAYINGKSVCEMLKQVHETYPGKEVHIILDNARYQKCSDVMDLAAGYHIILDYLPSYSPNLNLIERLWKFVKSELRQTYYDDFSVFKAKIAEIIASTTTTNYSRICKLIGEKIQLFDGLERIDCHTLVVPKKTA